MPVSIRPLLDSDLAGAQQLLAAAFQRAYDWTADLRLYRKIQPDGYFVAEQAGILVGMVGVIVYPTYAYVGLMAVHHAHQRQGIGLALMEHLLAWLERRRVSTVLLDASPEGQALYEHLGFVPYEEVRILERSAGAAVHSYPAQVRPLDRSDLERLAAEDGKAFGTDRGRVLRLLLEMYPERAFLLPGKEGQINGYLFAQPGRIGPWVMPDGRGAEWMLQAALSVPYQGLPLLVVPGENVQAVPLLRKYGFEIVRVNRHMARGVGLPTSARAQVFAQASLSLG